MRWYWWLLLIIWIGGPMVIIPAWYLMRRMFPIPDKERQLSDEGEMRALRERRRQGSPRKIVLHDPGPERRDGN